MSTSERIAVGGSVPGARPATRGHRALPSLDIARLRARARAIPLALVRPPMGIVTLMAVLYAAFFILIEYLRYHTYLMHALDMGNMEQALWNTAHGNPFHFNNLRIASYLEASGTDTRLSFHVEPILLLISLVYQVHASPVNLIVIQTVVVASGAFAAALLARRHLHTPLAQIAFPLAYLLAPPLESANLYEFHAVTLSAGLLLWALYFADGRRYGLFALCGVLAMATKEEIGLAVGAMGLWIWWRHRDRTVGLVTAILAVGWSLFAVLVIMRHFHNGPSSPYCGRFNPFVINGQNTTLDAHKTSCLAVAKLWLIHPDQVWSIFLIPQKLGFLHRMFVGGGYLSLLSPLTMLISLPSYALIMFSNDVHMYSGLGHYPAELVPIMIGSAIVGTAWLARVLAPRLHVAPAVIVSVASIWLLGTSVANAHANGFTPLAANFALPRETAHDVKTGQMLALIPPDAPVAAGDYLNPHLSDRSGIFLPYDLCQASYIALDVSRDSFPFVPNDEMSLVNHLLKTPDSCHHSWGIVYADDGLLLLEQLALDPHLPTILPPRFYTFVAPPAPPVIQHPLLVNYGPSLQLLGYKVERREEVNLRLPDVLLTTYWRVTSPVTSPITPVVYLTNNEGAIDQHETDLPATDWLPTDKWQVGQIHTLQAVPESVFANDNGSIDIDLAVYQPLTCASYPPGSCDLSYSSVHRYRPDVRWIPNGAPLEAVDSGTVLKLTSLQVYW